MKIKEAKISVLKKEKVPIYMNIDIPTASAINTIAKNEGVTKVEAVKRALLYYCINHYR